MHQYVYFYLLIYLYICSEEVKTTKLFLYPVGADDPLNTQRCLCAYTIDDHQHPKIESTDFKFRMEFVLPIL